MNGTIKLGGEPRRAELLKELDADVAALWNYIDCLDKLQNHLLAWEIALDGASERVKDFASVNVVSPRSIYAFWKTRRREIAFCRIYKNIIQKLRR